MKKITWTVVGLLALSLNTACSDIGGTNVNPSDIRPSSSLGITPQPKGPKPLDGVNLGLNLPTSAMQRADKSRNMEGEVAGVNQTTGGGYSAGTDIAAGAPAPTAADDSSAIISQPEPQPTAEATAQPKPQASASASSEPTPTVSASAEVQQNQQFFYFSYDDSASTAGVEQTKFALSKASPSLPQASWVRPWEFLSFEPFAQQGLETKETFKVSMGLWQHQTPGQDNQTAYDLGVHVVGPETSLSQRRNLALTLVLDVSGSMNNGSVALSENGSANSLLEIAKKGLKALPQQLKAGDVVSLVTFSTGTRILIDALAYSGDASAWNKAIDALKTEGGTNLNAGLKTGYEQAQKIFDPKKTNRVIMLTDAFANQGSVDASVISENARINDLEGIYFSGLGFGERFNEGFLNTLTEAGKGTYFSVITEKDATRAFGERFLSLVDIAARDVRFRLDYPAGLERTHSAAEQSSQVASEVQPIHFSSNTSQYFLEGFKTDGESTLGSGQFKLTINYTDPVTGTEKSDVLEKSFQEILNQDLNNIKDAKVVTLLTSVLTGKVTAEQARQQLDGLLQSHSSSLADEYKAYLETYLKLKGL